MLTLNDGRKYLYQWDTGRKATVDIDCDIIHFANLDYGEALSVEVISGEVEIPNQLLLSGEKLICWAFIDDLNGSYTKQKQIFEVVKRAKPSDYVYTETEVLTIEKVVENALEEAKESGDFKGDKGDKGDKGEKGEAGERGPAGSDASVTTDNIKKAGGLISPETMSVGQYFRIASIDEDGHAVLEAVDAPSTSMKIKIAETTQTPDEDGYVNIPLCGPSTGLINGYHNSSILGLGVSKGTIFPATLVKGRLENRFINSAGFINSKQIDFSVKLAMCDGEGEAWTDEEKTGAWKRLTSIKAIMDDVAVAGAQYFLGTQTEVSIVLPENAEIGQIISVSWYNGGTASTLSITGTILDFTYVPSPNSRSEINALWDGTYWTIISNEMVVPNDD